MKCFKFLLLFLTLTLCAARGASAGDELTITFFSVGAGDCILLRHGETSVMIDAGYADTAPAVLERLNEMGVRRLDLLLLTHWDRDHVGGAPEIIRALDVRKIFLPAYGCKTPEYKSCMEAAAESGAELTALSADAALSEASMDIAISAPKRHTGMVPNDHSAITTVRFGTRTFLFMADATDRRMKDFLKEWSGGCDLMKLPHHGYFLRKSAPFKKLLSAAKPQYGVVTDGECYPLDHALALMLEIYGVTAFETRLGEVTVTCPADGELAIEVTQQPAP